MVKALPVMGLSKPANSKRAFFWKQILKVTLKSYVFLYVERPHSSARETAPDVYLKYTFSSGFREY